MQLKQSGKIEILFLNYLVFEHSHFGCCIDKKHSITENFEL